MKFVAATLLAAFAASCYGGPPSKNSVYGVELGSTLMQVVGVLGKRYSHCQAELTGFRDEVRTEGVERISVSIEPGDGNRNCSATQPSSVRTASLAVTFVSEEVDAVGGAVEVSLDQDFDPRKSPPPKIRDLLGRLRAEYGEPTQIVTEQSQAVDSIDMPVPNLFYYQLRAIWNSKAPLQVVPCKARACSEVVLSATFSTHAPPGKKAADLPARTMQVVLRDVRLGKLEKVWYSKKVNAKK